MKSLAQVVEKFLLKQTKQTSHVDGKEVVYKAFKVGYFYGDL